jgi:hypothetical protein
LLGLVPCATGDAVTPASASAELLARKTASSLQKNWFAAVIAACENGARSSNNISMIEGCPTDYGLRRIQ